MQLVAARWRRRVDLDQSVREAYISDAEAGAGRIHDEELGRWRISLERAHGPEAQSKAPKDLPSLARKGERCTQVSDEMKRIKHMCQDGGMTMAEVREEHPEFRVWGIRDNLPPDDQEVFDHPRPWGPGYDKLVLSKEYGRSQATIKDWMKLARKHSRARNGAKGSLPSNHSLSPAFWAISPPRSLPFPCGKSRGMNAAIEARWKLRRVAAGLRQQDVAGIVGINTARFGQLERGEAEPRGWVRNAIEAALPSLEGGLGRGGKGQDNLALVELLRWERDIRRCGVGGNTLLFVESLKNLLRQRLRGIEVSSESVKNTFNLAVKGAVPLEVR